MCLLRTCVGQHRIKHIFNPKCIDPWVHQGEETDFLQRSCGCGQERLCVTSVWQWSLSRPVTLIFLNYVIRKIIFPPLCLKTHFSSNLSQLRQLGLVLQRAAWIFHYTGCLTLILRVWMSPFGLFMSSNITEPPKYHLLLPPQHCRKSSCQLHHQLIAGKNVHVIS